MPRKRKAAPTPHGYGNRTDLNTVAAKQAVTVPTGGAYGSATALAQAQSAAPVPSAGAGASPVLGGGGGGPAVAGPPGAAPPPVTPGGGMGDPMAAAQAFPPINLNMGAPTSRPGEPITTGVPSGPGAGPIAPPDPLVHAAAALNILQPQQVDPDTARLAAVINAHLANKAAP